MAEGFEEYRSSWCDMAQATPEVEFIVPIVDAAAQGAELPPRRKSQPPLLHESLANCSLLCALPGCAARSCIASGKKLQLCSGCRCGPVLCVGGSFRAWLGFRFDCS